MTKFEKSRALELVRTLATSTATGLTTCVLLLNGAASAAVNEFAANAEPLAEQAMVRKGIFHHPLASEVEAVRASWKAFGDENAVMELKAPVVSIYVENLESQDTEISLECSVIAEAASQKVNLPSYRLAAFKKGSIPVPLPIKALQLDRLQFSGVTTQVAPP